MVGIRLQDWPCIKIASDKCNLINKSRDYHVNASSYHRVILKKNSFHNCAGLEQLHWNVHNLESGINQSSIFIRSSQFFF